MLREALMVADQLPERVPRHVELEQLGEIPRRT